MMKVFFLSSECYPAAKVGGLADVVGALPKYLNQLGAEVSVVIPKYDLPWFKNKTFKKVYADYIHFTNETIYFTILKYESDELGYDLYLVDIPGKMDRKGVYADENGIFFEDEVERYISFQRAFLQWIKASSSKPDIVHCHDHHTGLVPFMMQYTEEFESLKDIPTVFSIHNQNYQGAFSWDKSYLLPKFDTWKSGLLDWANQINPLASAVKCSWKLNTVSPSYMEELQFNSLGLEWLFQNERPKSQGILNGIDTSVWDPSTDPLLEHHYKRGLNPFKTKNKKLLLDQYGLEKGKALISFIGRFALEKGADVLPEAIDYFLSKNDNAVFIVLGTGMKEVEAALRNLEEKYSEKMKAIITYNEKIAHEIYAGSDFIVMPSRVEPCGLNQMYAMRYGTVPIVRNIGGLKDSIVSIEEKQGTGIKFDLVTIPQISNAFQKAVQLYSDTKTFTAIRKRCFEQDFSWEHSANQYLNIYYELKQLH